jgi:diguanylate cyclase (GGDEF)-like protein/PAS domain S-box-containing protein
VSVSRDLSRLPDPPKNPAGLKVRLRKAIAERERAETARTKLEHGLQEVQDRFQSAFSSAPIGMALVDMGGQWLQINDALCHITGYSHDELNATTLEAITHPSDAHIAPEALERLVAGEIPSSQIELRYRHAWGHYVWVLLTISIVRNPAGGPLYFINQIQDISQRKQQARHLEYLVDHDFLTGLGNRRWFEQELAREAKRAARYGETAAVLVIDLDHFKDINDTLGHKAGDDLLKGVAGLLKHRTRQTDVLARLSGDEFAILLPQTDAEQAAIMAGEIVRALNRPTGAFGKETVSITASVGVAIMEGLTDMEVLAYADLAMYEAKEAGRNRFAVYEPLNGGRERVSARLADAERIRHALKEDLLLLYCQPILDLHTNEIRNWELLVRLPGDNGNEPVLPNSFLYVAERFGLVQALDSWVVKKATQFLAEHAHAHPDFTLSVNLSGKSIGDSSFASVIEEALDQSGIDPTRLILEVTETAAITHIEVARTFANRLSTRGCQFALDDFGAGFGSFYYLKNFPFQHIKIDGGFIRDFVSSPTDQLVVQAIVKIAQGLGKKTVAEFVGDDATVSLLRKFGVDGAQGYHIGRPRPISEVLRPGKLPRM